MKPEVQKPTLRPAYSFLFGVVGLTVAAVALAATTAWFIDTLVPLPPLETVTVDASAVFVPPGVSGLATLGGTGTAGDVPMWTTSGALSDSLTVPPPVAAGCGIHANVLGNDAAGAIFVGDYAGSRCGLTFGASFVNPPRCEVWDEDGHTAWLTVESPTGFAFDYDRPLRKGEVFGYECEEP